MNFHITLISDETIEENISYGVLFLPSVVFVENNEKLLVPNPATPKYELGFFEKLLMTKSNLINLKGNKKAHVLIEDIGHGTKADLDNLVLDLNQNNFNVYSTYI